MLQFKIDMRGKMRDAGKQSYSAAFEIGKPLDARGVAEVVESKNPKYPVGSIIHAFVGWEEYTVLPDLPTTRIIPEARESGLPLSSYVGVLGMPGKLFFFSFDLLLFSQFYGSFLIPVSKNVENNDVHRSLSRMFASFFSLPVS